MDKCAREVAEALRSFPHLDRDSLQLMRTALIANFPDEPGVQEASEKVREMDDEELRVLYASCLFGAFQRQQAEG